MNWRVCTNWAKRKHFMLRLSDWLGRGRGRMRLLDALHATPPAPHTPRLDNWHDHDLAAIWIGHATVLLRLGEKTILTDPVFARRVGLGLGLATAGPLRHVRPALSIRQLPPLDLILLSHAHYDHLDIPTLHRLPRRVPVVTAFATADLVRRLGYKEVHELRWGERCSLGGVNIEALPVAHWGARSFYDLHRGVNAYSLRCGRRHVLFGGDTAWHDGFAGVGRTDLAILGIGAYDPYVQAHATPEQAWAMANHARAEHILPMHHSTFRLSHEPMDEPLERLRHAAGRNLERLVAWEVGMSWVWGGRAAIAAPSAA